MKLTREVRCFPTADRRSNECNTWSGLPSETGIPTFWVLRATVDGPIDPKIGYVYDLAALDDILRGQVVDTLASDIGSSTHLFLAMPQSFSQIQKAITPPTSMFSLELALSPYLRLAVFTGDSSVVEITQSFEFSAGHQLWCDDYSEEQNRRVFGKCSNPNGHGHNYVIEISVTGTPNVTTGIVISLEELTHLVNERVIQPFDHKFLNRECDDFASLNPSVENIARVIWQRLTDGFTQAKLSKVQVWETPKTSATYSGQSE